MKHAINEHGRPYAGQSESTLDDIPACPDCKGDGCQACLWTGLTEEDCDFAGLAKHTGVLDVLPGDARVFPS